MRNGLLLAHPSTFMAPLPKGLVFSCGEKDFLFINLTIFGLTQQLCWDGGVQNALDNQKLLQRPTSC